MVIFTRLESKPGRREDLLEAFVPLRESVAGEPGTLVFAMHEARDEPDVVLCYEVYADEQALSAHRESAAVRSIVDRLGDLLAGTPVITYARPALRPDGRPRA